MEAPIRIRQAELSDWEEILAIEQLNSPAAEAVGAEVIKERIERISDTFLLAELHGQLVGYIVGPAVPARYLKDDLFSKVSANPPEGGFIVVQSLSVHSDCCLQLSRRQLFRNIGRALALPVMMS